MSFPPTRLSVVVRTRSPDEHTRRLAFDTLIGAYWKPVYKYLRLKWQTGPDDAADLTQDFFTNVLEKDVLARFDPARARFRTYLRVCLDGFVSNRRKAAARFKRGGHATIVPLDFPAAESELSRQTAPPGIDLDDLFYQEWVRTLFQQAVADLRAAAGESGRGTLFAVFERYDLADPEDRPTYAAIARELGLTTATVTNHLAAMRRELRARVLARLRDLTTTDNEYEAEARRLIGGGR